MVQYLWENVLRRPTEANNLKNFLQTSFLFQDLNSRELSFLKHIVHLRHYEPGEKVFKQGDPGAGMYLILSGSVDIVMHDTTTDTPEGPASEIFITRLDRHDFFGELSLIEDPSFRSATAIAVTKVTLIGFFKPDLLQIIQRNPLTGNKISLRLAEILGRRLRETTEKVTELGVELNELRKDPDGTDREKHFTS